MLLGGEEIGVPSWKQQAHFPRARPGLLARLSSTLEICFQANSCHATRGHLHHSLKMLKGTFSARGEAISITFAYPVFSWSFPKQGPADTA